MAAYFILTDDDVGRSTDAKLTSYSGAVSGTKILLTLKVEIPADDVRYVLGALDEILAAHKKKPKAAPKMRGM